MTYLVFMAGTLAVLGDGLQGLANQVHVALINVKAKQAQASCGAPTNTVQELKSLTYQIIVGLVVLVAQEVLKVPKKKKDQSGVPIKAAGFGTFRDEASTCKSVLWFSQSSCRKRRIGFMMAMAGLMVVSSSASSAAVMSLAWLRQSRSGSSSFLKALKAFEVTEEASFSCPRMSSLIWSPESFPKAGKDKKNKEEQRKKQI